MRILSLLFTSLIVASSAITSSVDIANAKTEVHGFLPDENNIKKIKYGQTPTEILEILGSPNVEDNLQKDKDKKTWYYIKDITQVGFLGGEQTLPGSRMIVIKFSDNQVSELQIIDMSSSKTSKRIIRPSTIATKPDSEIKESGIELIDILSLDRM